MKIWSETLNFKNLFTLKRILLIDILKIVDFKMVDYYKFGLRSTEKIKDFVN